ncbi:16S rRNA (adenine(1518)-N(6)/adenine(1519)-N(6))-dimethyltransferase RsmA [Proteinivorax hydrogeniformans]|uniref:Ribosomal RNA small subunit methyltransferase A n=1 Tax=Proteinivorax hydrogeniformans TaxID=1826727 RepID=A0AAU8HTY9_9FIRM
MSNVTKVQQIKEFMAQQGFSIKKKFGQNFLIDKNALEKIVTATEPDNNTTVLEIGPGLGVLTNKLADSAGKVISIEIDKTLESHLKELEKKRENINVVFSDALKLDLSELLKKDISEGRKLKVTANLPYYITTPLLFKMLESKVEFESLTLMMQLEVAQRILASPGGKEYGNLTVAVQYYGEASMVTKVPPSCFYPQPKVDSAVINIKPRDKSVKVLDETFFFRLIKQAFSKRRKTLVNNLEPLADLSKCELTQILEELDIDGKRRAETLSIEEFAKVSDELIKYVKK